MDIDSIYTNLTGVDIKKQEDLWDERGKGYYGEYLLFRELFYFAPGWGKFLMNVQIPGLYTEDTEIDLLYLHETGIYVFEVKHYKGTIYGKVEDDHWTQYFKTTKNNVFYNPVKQNRGHINALKALIKKDVPIHSFVVFTNDEVDLRITGTAADVTICTLRQVCDAFMAVTAGRPAIYNTKQLDDQYSFLLPYSKVVNAEVPLSSDAMTLPEFLKARSREAERNRRDYEAQLDIIDAEYASKKKAYLKRCLIAALAVIVIAAGVAFGAITSAKTSAEKADQARLKAEAETAAMRQNFEHVDNRKTMEQSVPEDFLTASGVQVIDSEDIDNAVSISGVITVKNDIYSAKFSDNTVIIVQLVDGTVKEYGFFDGINRYVLKNNSYHNQNIQLGQSVDKLILAGVTKDKIKYIKISRISLCDYPFGNTIRNDLEMELYSR